MLADEGSMRASSVTPYRWPVRYGVPCSEVGHRQHQSFATFRHSNHGRQASLLGQSSRSSEGGGATVMHAVMSSTEEARGACGLVLQIWGQNMGMRWDDGDVGRGDDVTLSVMAGEELHRRSGGVGPLPKRPSSSIHKSEYIFAIVGYRHSIRKAIDLTLDESLKLVVLAR